MKHAFIAAAVLSLLVSGAAAQDLQNGKLTKLPGMNLPGSVTREANGIPHVFAFTLHDAYFLNGWLHAQDRMFQMDTNRRIASGTLAEILGQPALSNDVQFRTFGLRRAAEASLAVASQPAKEALDAYTAGVNAYASTHAVSSEYGVLELSVFQPWVPVDSLAVGKLIAFGLSFDLDIDSTTALLTYQGIGKVAGFDGTALFFNDTWRIQPFSKAATIPDATGAGSTLPLRVAGTPEWIAGASKAVDDLPANTLQMLLDYREKVRDLSAMEGALNPDLHAGSNEFAVAGRNTTTGNALIANDPHLSLSNPSTFYPISLYVPGKLNVSGMGFPGAPFVIQGQNERIAWGSTVHPMDVTDLYSEQLVPDATSPSGLATVYQGKKEAVVPIPQTFRVNNIGNGVKDDLAVVPSSSSVPAAVLVVPRHGPVISATLPTAAAPTGSAISVQYTGFYPTHELEAFMLIDQAKNADDFKAALQYFDFGSQNFAFADVDGNIAYFTSGELPIREDLQAGKVNGLPPYFIRNGTGGNEWMAVKNPQPNQAVPYEILPYAEMPQVLNPSNGWFVNANNDPTGQTLDNDPLNTPRAGGGILYLNPGYDGIRAGRITQMMRAKLANGGKVSADDMKNFQADTVLLDAEVFVPYITKALANAKLAGADPTLAALGSIPAVNEAVGRLAKWDFTTPTGIQTGYDASDVNGALSTPSQAEVDSSIAATIFGAWRSRFLANTIDGLLGAVKAPLPPSQQALSAMRYHLENFATNGGKGASGLNFFNVPNVSDAGARRDVILLKSVSDALTMLASDAFKAAFNNSTNQSDYQWGKLHRVVFANYIPLYSIGAPFAQPPRPSILTLPGVSTDGGYGTVDAATHNARATTPDGFMFGSGPNRRYVGEMAKSGIQGQSSLPGGVSSDPNSPWFNNLLMLWLTNDTFPINVDQVPRIPWLGGASCNCGR